MKKIHKQTYLKSIVVIKVVRKKECRGIYPNSARNFTFVTSGTQFFGTTIAEEKHRTVWNITKNRGKVSERRSSKKIHSGEAG